MQKKGIFRISFSNDGNTTGIAALSEIELLYVIEGVVDVQMEQKYTHLKKEDILVINPDRRRNITVIEKSLILRLMIDYSVLRDAFQTQDVLVWCNSTSSDHEKYNELRELLKNLIRHYVQWENYEESFSFLSDCYSILHLLALSFTVKAADVRWNEDGDRFEERLFKINHYINSNYDQTISIKDLSEKLYLSIGYLSRFFKKNYGMSFANYLTNVRLVYAVDELLYSNISVTRVAYDCGFTSAASFNKAFKKVYNVTPTEFRKNAVKEESTEDRISTHKELENYIGQEVLEHELAGEAIQKTDIVRHVDGSFSVLNPEKFHNRFNDTISFADASNLLDPMIREHIRILKKSIPFQYVRFWGVFSRDFHIRPDQDQYNFGKIDAVLDFILEQDLKPFIDLGAKPRTLHYEPGQSEIIQNYEVFTDEQWIHMMTAFMRHLSSRYGQNELDHWRMELWFDEGLRWDKTEGDRYLERFAATYQVIKSFNKNILVGGYGIRMDFGAVERLELLEKWKKNPVNPDFISIMYYAYERGSDGLDTSARRSTDDDAFLHHLNAEKETLKKAGMGEIPISVCEWNLTPSVRNNINDTCFKGAYVVKNLIDLSGSSAYMGYGTGSDMQYSSYDTPGLLFGGNGLISREGILKPAAFALQFAGRLYNRIIGKSSHYLITTDEHNNYSILCHNQQKLNDNYYLISEMQVQRDAIWKYFDRMTKLRLQIHLKDLKDGVYRVKVYRVNNQFGSVLDVWETMNFENDLSKHDIAYLKRTCEPKMTIKKMQTDGGNMMLQEEMAPNEIALISIRYLG